MRTAARTTARTAARPARIVLRTRRPALSVRLDRRTLVVLVLTVLAALAAAVVTLTVGQIAVSPGEVWAALFGRATPTDQLVIGTLRLPRLLAAGFVGAALGASGAVFQSVADNPLVAPDIIGINSGAALAVVGAVVVGGSAQPPGLFGFGGALVVAVAVYLLSVRSGLSRFRMVLIGIGVNALLGAITTYLLTQASTDQVAALTQYLLGDVSSTTWPTVDALVPVTVVLLVLALALGPQLQVLALDDAVAVGVGARVGPSRLVILAVAVALAAVAVTAAGPVGFVAFIAPHIARRLTRASGTGVLPTAAAAGATLVIAADYAAQRLLEPTQLPVGILTVVIGGPYFLVLLVRTTRTGFGG